MSSKNLWKMISPDVKANLNQKEIKELVALSYKLLWEVPLKLKIQWAIPEKNWTGGWGWGYGISRSIGEIVSGIFRS